MASSRRRPAIDEAERKRHHEAFIAEQRKRAEAEKKRAAKREEAKRFLADQARRAAENVKKAELARAEKKQAMALAVRKEQERQQAEERERAEVKRSPTAEQKRMWTRFSRDRFSPVRFLSASFMKAPGAQRVLNDLAKRGQNANMPRTWFITSLIELVHGLAGELERAGISPPDYEFSPDAINKASARLFRKIPLHERC